MAATLDISVGLDCGESRKSNAAGESLQKPIHKAFASASRAGRGHNNEVALAGIFAAALAHQSKPHSSGLGRCWFCEDAAPRFRNGKRIKKF